MGRLTNCLVACQSLPAPVKRRIKALKQLQLKTTNIEAKFYEEVHALECRYYQLCVSVYQERSNIISGVREPTDEECVWDSEEEEEITNDLKSKVKIQVKDEAELNKDNGYVAPIHPVLYVDAFSLFCWAKKAL